MKKLLPVVVLCMLAFVSNAQNKEAKESPYYIDNDSILITVVMRHLQENPVDTIQNRVMQQGFYTKLNNSHAKVVSWNVVMGIGQIITLKLKPQYIREVNQVFESGAWGGFKTEFYPTYNFMPIYPTMKKKEEKLHSKK